MNSASWLKGPILFLPGLGLLASCGSPSPTTAPAATPTAPVIAEPSATPAETSGKVVTLDDNGQTITMKAGERFLLRLGEEYGWSSNEKG